MRTFKRAVEANVWHRVFLILPRRINTLTTKDDVKFVESSFYYMCFVERRFAVVKGILTGVEYRTIAKTDHERCSYNCGLPGCEAPIGLNLTRLQRMIK